MERTGGLLWIALGLLLAGVWGCPNADEPARRPGAATEGVPGEAPPTRDRPRIEERAAERTAMVRDQIEARGVKDPDVLRAMRNAPRHLFVPQNMRRAAYDDSPLPIGHGQTISQPYIVALMTELLAIRPGDRVLEVGTGSGYQAAVLAELTPHVYSIEILEALHERASAQLAAVGYGTIRTRRDDGYYGWPDEAPFDAIIVTAAAGHVPPPLTAQLRPGGRMAIPVGPVYGAQQLVLISKDEEGRLSTRSVLPVRFVPLTGRAMDTQ
ncbi:MAG: protein-L-isoaspartate(D-aspartate) O-methyltransferase [Candidatus Brocadiaceae bacterium]|nr:protein-L-isoaspartate(D-aspartate) O-methyltransferase [Candidatus Brocadiaceae bacterium]